MNDNNATIVRIEIVMKNPSLKKNNDNQVVSKWYINIGILLSVIFQNAEMPVNKPNTLDNTLNTVADMTQINFCVLETMSYL